VGALPPWAAAWSFNILFGGIGLVLLARFLR
jgi:lipopolysaccharide export system permease protein